MKSALSQIYKGDISGFEHIAVKGEKYRSINEKLSLEKERLTERMYPDERERFERIEDLYCELLGLEKAEAFRYGFKLGAMIMMEVLADEDE